MSDPVLLGEVIASIWCCRPCRCGVVVHTEDGRDPANACTHGDAICGHCAPGECPDCIEESA